MISHQCKNCPMFFGSDRLPSIGKCSHYEEKVRACDTACQHFHQNIEIGDRVWCNGMEGTVIAVNTFSEIPYQIQTANSTKSYLRGELTLIRKASITPRKKLETGQELRNGRIATTGNYAGLSRRNAIRNARLGISDKLAQLQIQSDLEAAGLA